MSSGAPLTLRECKAGFREGLATEPRSPKRREWLADQGEAQMPRRGIIKKRKIQPDSFYNSTLIAKFINLYLKRGKKSTAERVIYNAMELVKQKTKEDPLRAFEKAIENARPVLETKSRRVGGATYQVPVEVSIERSTSVAVRWLLNYARERSGKSMEEKLAAEIIDALNKRGGAIKKREDTHKMAEANRAFAHYRW
jgi:small subunit ribosomal protein S7